MKRIEYIESVFHNSYINKASKTIIQIDKINCKYCAY